MLPVYKIACMKHINKFLLKEGAISQEVYWKMSTKLISVENDLVVMLLGVLDQSGEGCAIGRGR